MGPRTNSEAVAIILWELLAIAGILIWTFMAWPLGEQSNQENAIAEVIESPMDDPIPAAENTEKLVGSDSAAKGSQGNAGGPRFPYNPSLYFYPAAYGYASFPYPYFNLTQYGYASYPSASNLSRTRRYPYQTPYGFNPVGLGYPSQFYPKGLYNPGIGGVQVNPGTYKPSPSTVTKKAVSVPIYPKTTAGQPAVPSVKLVVIPTTSNTNPAPTSPSSPSSPSASSAVWLPDRSQWPPSTNFQAAAVSSGNRYWRLVRALYCDSNDTRNNCPNLPGGGTGTSTYVMLLDSSGGRTDAPLASPSGQEQKSPSDMCNCNYTFQNSGTAIQIGGHPSDTLSGLILYSVQAHLSNYHVRYFLTFQLSTK